MTNLPPNPNPENPPTLTPLRCLTGAVIAGTMATGLYFLTVSIAESFAKSPIPTTNQTAINISIAVRTLVVGVSTMATAVFGIIGLGLILLAIQTINPNKN